jgi:hypothetical protein
MTKEAPWHSKTMALPGASLVGGDERVYHDNNACPVGQRIPAVRREDGAGKDLRQCPTCAELGARSREAWPRYPPRPPVPHHPM